MFQLIFLFFLPNLLAAASTSMTTLFMDSTASFVDNGDLISLKFRLRLQGNPAGFQLIGCLSHQLSAPIHDDFFVITLGQGITHSKQFSDHFSMILGSGGPIPVSLTFGNQQIPLFENFSLNYTNFFPEIKYGNGSDAIIPECRNELQKDSTLICLESTILPLHCDAPEYTSTTTSRTIQSSTESHSTTQSATTTGLKSESPTTNSILSSTTSTTKNIGFFTNSSSTTALQPPFLPPIPSLINCTDPTSQLDTIYCDLTSDEIIPTAGNISFIANATLKAIINATKMSKEDIYAVAYILQQCSFIQNLTNQDFSGMSKLIDEIMLAPDESYKTANEYSNSANSIISTINRMLINSPSDSKYFDGINIAFHGKSLDCQNAKDASGISDSGNGFGETSNSDSLAFISINGETICEAKGTRVFYTIYRNSKFFVGDISQTNGLVTLSSKLAGSATSKNVIDAPRSCKNGLLSTDGRVVSATALKQTSKGYEIIHEFEGKEMVYIKFSQKHIGIPLHGKLKVGWWDSEANKWSLQTCTVELHSNQYIAKCPHLTDFTLLVDGIALDPVFCNTLLQTINLFFQIGSIIGLFLLCLIYLTMIIPYASELKIVELLFAIIPISDISMISMIYTFILLLFYFNFTIFTDQRNTTGYRGCMTSAIISYWLLMCCIILSLFNSWRIIKEHLKGTTMDNFFGKITTAKVIYPVTFFSSTLIALIFGFATSGDFFYRNDSFCWVRPDYRLAIVIPFTILGLSAILCVIIMTLRRFPIFEKYLLPSTVTTINRRNPQNVKTRLFVLFLTQFNLGAPWLLQYFTLFSPNATAWHYLFVIFNGSQGIVIFVAFIFRCYMESKIRKNHKDQRHGEKNGKLQTHEYNAENPEYEIEIEKVDEDCIEVISRNQRYVNERPKSDIKRTNAKRIPTQKARNRMSVERNSVNKRKEADENLKNSTPIINNIDTVSNKIPTKNHVNEISPKSSNKETYVKDNYHSNPEQRHPSEGEFTEAVDHESACENTRTTSMKKPLSSNHANDLISHKSENSLDLDYILDRVNGIVIRIYKDPNHSHFYHDFPPKT